MAKIIKKVAVKKMQAGGVTKSEKRVGPVDPNGAYTKVQERNLPPVNVKTSVSLKKDKELDATPIERKQAGAKMKNGGSLKSVDKAKNPGLSKLPTAVRNKMGYQKNGGASKMKDGGKLGSGERFAALKSKIQSKGKSAKAAGAIAASIGRKKYGAKKMTAMAVAGRKKAK